MKRTRIKICGLTREDDVDAAIAAGADAIGLVFYPPSPRYVSIERAMVLRARIPAFVSVVGLFVNADPASVLATSSAVRLDLLQFHGDETGDYCRQFGRSWIKAARVRPGLDLIEYASGFAGASGLLLDAFVEGYGGGGKTFDWTLIPEGLSLPLILSGGLDAANVGAAVTAVRPWAVDVSSGVEAARVSVDARADGTSSLAKGIKDAAKIAEFIAGVRHADAGSSV